MSQDHNYELETIEGLRELLKETMELKNMAFDALSDWVDWYPNEMCDNEDCKPCQTLKKSQALMEKNKRSKLDD